MTAEAAAVAPSSPKLERRSWSDAVRAAVMRLLGERGLARALLAEALGLAASTLSRWSREPEKPRSRGRPAWQPTLADCCRVLKALYDAAGSLSVRALKRLFPHAPRSWLAEMQRRDRQVRSARRRAALSTLTWTTPGTVWAMDFTALEGRSGPRALCVLDVASGEVLYAAVVGGERADCVRPVLTALFAEHGAPLVLKEDNGSAFREEGVLEELRRHGVTPLYSPPRRPRYNGACERMIGRRKQVAEELRAAHEPDTPLGDLFARAAEIVNARRGVGGPRLAAAPGATPELRARFVALRDENRRRLRAERGIATDAVLAHHEQASLDRAAVRDALCELNLLIIQRPDFQRRLRARGGAE